MPIVLIADDEPNIRRMVGALLTGEGYEVTETPTGIEAIARVKEGEPVASVREAVTRSTHSLPLGATALGQ